MKAATIGVLVVLAATAIQVVINTLLSYLRSRDAEQTVKKITLLDTVIEAKNIDITKDLLDVEEKSDAYEKIKSRGNNTSN